MRGATGALKTRTKGVQMPATLPTELGTQRHCRVFFKDVPQKSFVALIFISVISVFLSQTNLRLISLPPSATGSVFKCENHSCRWTIVGGEVKTGLRMTISAWSSIVGLLATVVLLLGCIKDKPYLLVPWLVVTLRGFLTYQMSFILDLIDKILSSFAPSFTIFLLCYIGLCVQQCWIWVDLAQASYKMWQEAAKFPKRITVSAPPQTPKAPPQMPNSPAGTPNAKPETPSAPPPTKKKRRCAARRDKTSYRKN